MMQPLAQVLRRRNLIGCTGKASSNRNADTAKAAKFCESIAISDIIAAEKRRATYKGRILHERAQSRAFVRAGRLQFEIFLAVEKRKPRFGSGSFDGGDPVGGQTRVCEQPILQGQRHFFVFDEHAWALRTRDELRTQFGRDGPRQMSDRGIRIRPDLRAVRARRRKFEWREEMVDILERAAAYQRQSAVTALAQKAQIVDQLGWDLDGMGRGRDVEQRAVDIQKERGLIQVGRR